MNVKEEFKKYKALAREAAQIERTDPARARQLRQEAIAIHDGIDEAIANEDEDLEPLTTEQAYGLMVE